MDYFYNVFMNFKSSGVIVFQWMDRNLSGLFKNIFICVSKMNENIMGLEQVSDDFYDFWVR